MYISSMPSAGKECMVTVEWDKELVKRGIVHVIRQYVILARTLNLDFIPVFDPTSDPKTNSYLDIRGIFADGFNALGKTNFDNTALIPYADQVNGRIYWHPKPPQITFSDRSYAQLLPHQRNVLYEGHAEIVDEVQEELGLKVDKSVPNRFVFPAERYAKRFDFYDVKDLSLITPR